MLLRLTSILFLALITLVPIVAQQNSTPTTQNRDKVEFKEVDLGFIKLEVPAALQKQDPKCIEGGCWQFSGSGMVLSVDWNVDCWRPTFERNYRSYTEDIVLVDEVRARLWSFKKDENTTFQWGANYATEKGYTIGLGIYFSSNSKNDGDIAKRIFNSVKFTKRPIQ